MGAPAGHDLSARRRSVSDRRKLAIGSVVGSLVLFRAFAAAALAESGRPPLSPTNIFAPVSTPAQSIFELSRFVLMVTGAIFVVVFSLLVYAVVKFRKRGGERTEPAQVYGSTQVELAWTVI